MSNGCGSHRSRNSRAVTKSEEHNTNHTVKRLAREITTQKHIPTYARNERRRAIIRESGAGMIVTARPPFRASILPRCVRGKDYEFNLVLLLLPSSPKNDRDSKNNSRSSKRSSPREREKFLVFFFFILFFYSLVNDRFYAKIFKHYR